MTLFVLPVVHVPNPWLRSFVETVRGASDGARLHGVASTRIIA